ncbi:MAG: WbqC family protein [Acidobacteriales bacterium]|nr:WbqC family protein [Terriglobales bacterium]
MIVSINQPAYLPWLGYFHRIAASDAHVVLDHVQFEKNSFINRNKIRTPEGWRWLTVPVKTAGKFGDLPINQTEIANDKPWSDGHWQNLRLHYSRAPFFAQHAGFFENIYSRQWEKLADVTREITAYLLNAFEIRTKLYYSSQMNFSGKKDELVLSLCRELNATTYLSGPLGRNYLRQEIFHDAKIAVRFDDYAHPQYAQAYPGFEPNLAAIDLLFNAGPESLTIVSGSQKGART